MHSHPEILAGFCDPLRSFWHRRFHARLSLPQQLAIPPITRGENVLICAPTGSGKTLAAFAPILDDLLRRHAAGNLPDTIDTVYISPLRALGGDITRNLITPLEDIAANSALSTGRGQHSALRVAQRTGDTSPRDRRAMLKLPPHILVTTPESLALCLASAPMRDHLRAVRRIVVDELHALAPNKRGADLSLTLERLADLVLRAGNPDPQRIGMSATIAPLDRIARYLVGAHHFRRDCFIADASSHRPLDIETASLFGPPTANARRAGSPFQTAARLNKNLYDFLERTIRAHRTTLVFTNLRSATERVTFSLRKRFAAALDKGESHTDNLICPDHIHAHHSSLDRDLRLDIERRLKAGELRCVVCSTSLELGVDIGSIDRVILLNSPKGVARGLQRVGRAGHQLDGTARGTFLPTAAADLVEALVTADAMRARAVDQIRIPDRPLDVLAQHLIGIALQFAPDGIPIDDAFQIVRRAFPYADLTRDQFDAVLAYLSDADAHSPRICIDDARIFPRGHAALYSQNVGTITQESQVAVRIAKGALIGKVEEAFAQSLKPGDRFVLAGRCVAYLRTHCMTIDVEECAGQMPTVPRWFSGMMSMESGLALAMTRFRAHVRDAGAVGEKAIARMLTRRYAASADVASTAAQYLHAQLRYAAIPAPGELLVERVPDEGSTVLVFHTMIGRAANEALARVVALRLHNRFGTQHSALGGGSPQHASGGAAVVVDDYAFGVWVPADSAARHADRTLVRSLLSPASFNADLAAAIDSSQLFRTQFRYTAIRAHALLQNKFGRRRFVGQLQGYADRLCTALLEDERDGAPPHLLLDETRRTVRDDILNAPAALAFVAALSQQHLRLLDLPSPSPFAFNLFAAAASGSSNRRDRLALADTADFLLAMYNQIQSRLTPPPLPRQELLFS